MCTLLLLAPVVLGWHVGHLVKLTLASFNATPGSSFTASFTGVSAVVGSVIAPFMDALADYPVSSVAPPAGGTLVTSGESRQCPHQLPSKLNSASKGSFLVNFISTPGGSFLPATLACWPLVGRFPACQPWPTYPDHGSWLLS